MWTSSNFSGVQARGTGGEAGGNDEIDSATERARGGLEHSKSQKHRGKHMLCARRAMIRRRATPGIELVAIDSMGISSKRVRGLTKREAF